jgi:two-component system, OmpR family, sensor histidine kinase KdpD
MTSRTRCWSSPAPSTPPTWSWGSPAGARVAQLLSRGVGMTTTALSGPIDVHMVTHEHARTGPRRLPASGAVTARRRLAGFAVAAAELPLATVLLAALRDQLSLPSDILTVMAVVVAAAIAGGS